MRINKLLFLTLLLMTLSPTSILATPNGEGLFKTKCASCHSMTRPADISKVVAPAVMGVMRHIKMSYPQKDKAVAFIKDYVINPSVDKAICMPQKLKRFGLMPSQKGSVTDEELEIITTWMFDNFPSKNFRGMSRGERQNRMKKKPFLIRHKMMPHLTKMVLKNWDDEDFNLTKEQKTELVEIRERTLKGVRAIAPEVNQLETEIATASASGEKVEKIYPLVEKVAKLKSEATKLHLECIYDTKQVLTKEQLESLLEGW